MLVTFLDKSVPYDGHSPTSHPLGGGEKTVVGLAGALAKRGHTVRVFNGCEAPNVVDGVSWQPLKDCKAAQSDWLIAHRDPTLLRMIPDAARRAMLLTAPGDTLAKSEPFQALNEYRPTLFVQGLAHSLLIPPLLQTYDVTTLQPGISAIYREAEDMAPTTPPHAVVTTHPLRGFGWLMDIWNSRIHPRARRAELHVYSAVLHKGSLGAKVSTEVRLLLDQAMAADSRGVRIMRPMADPEMIDVYRRARVHLYPSSSRDVMCSTLAESQAVGLPAVARHLGATDERIRNGETGYLAPDAEAFANLAVQLFDDDGEMFDRLSQEARQRQRHLSWDRAAEELERSLA
jgi:hypothetical protein